MTNFNSTLLYCENREQFYVGTNRNCITLWSKNKSDAKRFLQNECEQMLRTLEKTIADHKYLVAMDEVTENYL